MTYFIILLVCIVVNEGLAELLSKSVFFGPLRSFLSNRTNSVLQFFSRAIECPYCSSVWTAMLLTLLVFVFVTPVFSGVVFLDTFLFLVACHRFSNHLHDIADRYFTKEYLK